MAEGGRNLRIKPFTVDEDHIATGEKWDDWLEELEREMRFFRICDAADKKDAMLFYGGAEIRRLEMQVLEDTSEQVEVMGRQNSNSISKIGKRKKEKSKSLSDARQKESNKTCKYCGKTHPMQKELCPAYGKFCSKCGRPNHFSTVCMSSKETLMIEAKRKSDGRTMQRDASKFKLFHEDRSRGWRERLLRSSRPSKVRIPNTDDVIPTQSGRNERENEAMQEGYENQENGNQQHDVEVRIQHNRQQEPLRRQQPQRTRRLPYKLKDYVVGFKNRETEL